MKIPAAGEPGFTDFETRRGREGRLEFAEIIETFGRHWLTAKKRPECPAMNGAEGTMLVKLENQRINLGAPDCWRRLHGPQGRIELFQLHRIMVPPRHDLLRFHRDVCDLKI